MKKRFLSVLLLLVLALALAAPALAAGDTMTLYPVSCTKDGREYSIAGEYLVLNQDGTGMLVFSTCAYGIEWRGRDGGLDFTDSKGNVFSGSYEGEDMLRGTYRGVEYLFRIGGRAPILGLSPDTWGKGLAAVTDQAGILSPDERARLTEKAEELTSKYGCGVYIVTLDDMRNFSLTGRAGEWDEGGGFRLTEVSRQHGELTPVETCAEEIRTGYDLGYGPDRDCVVLLLSMAERDYDLVSCGPFAEAALTGDGREYMQGKFLDDFKDDHWAAGFRDYLDSCGTVLQCAADGAPFDRSKRPVGMLPTVAASVAVGFFIAFIVASIMKSTMKATKEETVAGGYISEGGVDIAYRYDRYTHTTESRVYDPPKSSGGGGGGGHSSSSGHSHSSGKF